MRDLVAVMAWVTVGPLALPAFAEEGAEVVSFYGYQDCIRLSNAATTVTLCPAAGGCVLEYSLHGTNVLYLPQGDEGWQPTPESRRGPMNAGRFDIGPEKVVQRGLVLWQGAWQGDVTGNRAAKMTSQFDPKSGVRLVRHFQLDHQSSRLRCTQTIINESDHPVNLCHWSRTFAVGGGVAVVPRSPRGRFPVGYVMYAGGNQIQLRPSDANIRVSDEAVVITAAPEFPKLGFDSHAGWLAYLAPTDQMFIKRYRTFPDRAYNEAAGLTLSVWYPQGEMVELEPIGPAEELAPGDQASFSEEWWLIPHQFPSDTRSVEFERIEKKVRDQSLPALADPEPPRSPEVHADGKVTFRLTAPTADRVIVRLDGHALELKPHEQGRLQGDTMWQLTTDPMSPGIYDYTFEVDGARITDPRNRWLKKWKVCASLLEIPADPPLLTEQRSVPHGSLHQHTYWSKAAGSQRGAIVYTPPGYQADAKTPYPLLVLCHGNGDDQTAWTEVGRVHHILDNLIAEEKIPPMVVVMPNGHPLPLGERRWSENYNERNRWMTVDDIATGVLPLVGQFYHVTHDASQRAITGLSMGGGQAIAAGMSHPELFHWVGAFSASAPEGDLASEHPRLALDQSSNDQRKLFWIACGKEDSLLDKNREFAAQLDKLGIEHRYVETEGGHNWSVWREYLPEFLQMLFR